MSELFQGVSPLQRALNYHLERHNVLASNVANVDTPGFRPRELLRSTEEAPGGLSVKRTDPGHMVRGGIDGPSRVIEDNSVPAGNDGNAVSLDREMAKVAANDLRYSGAAKIVSKQLAMLRYAASDGTRG